MNKSYFFLTQVNENVILFYKTKQIYIKEVFSGCAMSHAQHWTEAKDLSYI